MVKAKRDILNEPFTQEMVNKFESELLRLEKPYFKKLGNSIYKTAQVEVPVQSGNLRDSATLAEADYTTGEAFSIKYAAPYAYALHEGEQVTPQELESTGQYPWSAYTRSYMRQGKRVREHFKTYKKYYKPVYVNNSFWASLDQAKVKHKGNKWLQKAWKYTLSGEDSLAKKLFPKKLTIKKLETDQVWAYFPFSIK